MADGTAIEWTHRPGTKGETWNPLAGCSVLSPGCAKCYAMRMAARIEAINAAAGTPTHYAGTTRKVEGKARGGERSERGGKSVWTGKVALAPGHILTAPLRWRSPRTVFVNSMSDLFHEDVPDRVIDRIFAIMALCPQHTFQVLTKRSKRMREYFDGRRENFGRASDMLHDTIEHSLDEDAHQLAANRLDLLDSAGRPQSNVWLGVSAERQQEADERVPDLLATPAAIRFVSAEPLLGPIDFTALRPPEASRLFGFPIVDALRGIHMSRPHQFGPIEPGYVRLDQIIVGGESGPDARPMHPDWPRSIRDQCADAGTAFFFKQWGSWAPGECANKAVTRTERVAELWSNEGEPVHWNYGTLTPRQSLETHRDDEPDVYWLGKKAAGRLLDGVEHNAFPEVRP